MKPGHWDEAMLAVTTKQVDGTRIRVFADRPQSLGEMLKNAVARFPRKAALICNQTTVTYDAFGHKVAAVASALQLSHGVRKGDRVAILFSNTIEFCVSFFAITRIGAICIPLNYRLSPDEMVYQLEDTGAGLLIYESVYHDKIKSVRAKTNGLNKLFVVGEAAGPGVGRFDELAAWTGRDDHPVPVDEEDIASIMYTSGTTGKPKGAMLCHRNLICNAMSAAHIMAIGPDTRQIVLTPLFHASALHSQLMTSMLAGGTLVLMKEFKTRESLELMAKEKVNLVIAVPTMYWFWVNTPDFDRFDFSSLQYTISGGAPAAPELITRLAAMFPNAKFINAGGMTESVSFTFALPPGDALRKLGSIGWATPCMDIRVANENGESVGPEEIGELWYSGAAVCKGYWNKPEATRQTFKEGWLLTGDMGRFDEEGFLFLMDRKKDMIIRGGENIYSVEVENTLYAHPDILEAAVVGVPDQIFGEKVKAVVVPKPGHEVTGQSVKSFCQEHLAGYKIPEYIEIVDALPRTPSGKVKKNLLRNPHPQKA
jgi:acyl-CoA synthetase (AMP-forming)/AMP-acid ligase II